MAFSTHDQMVEALQVPEKVLNEMSTKALVKTCLNYPLLGDAWAFNNKQKGFEKVIADFNGLKKLLERDSSGIVRLEQYEILEKIQQKDRIRLLSLAIEKYFSKKNHSEIFRIISAEANAYLIGCILLTLNFLDFENLVSNDANLKLFLIQAVLVDPKISHVIVENANNFLNAQN